MWRGTFPAGTCGVLDKSIKDCAIILPTSAMLEEKDRVALLALEAAVRISQEL